MIGWVKSWFLILSIAILPSFHVEAKNCEPVYRTLNPFSSEKSIEKRYLSGIEGGSLIFRIAGNQTEPATFILRAKNSCSINVNSIVMKDLRGESDRPLNPDVNIKVVKYWYQAQGAWETHLSRGKEEVLIPELLLSDDSIIKVDYYEKKNYLNNNGLLIDTSSFSSEDERLSIPADQFPIKDSKELQRFDIESGGMKQLWVDISLGKDPTPGRYKGSLQVNYGRNSKLIIPVEIIVYPFTLKGSFLDYAIYYRGRIKGDNEPLQIGSELKSEEQLRAEFKNMRDHGITFPTIYENLLERENLETHLLIRKDLGMTQGPFYYLGRTTGRGKDERFLIKLKSDVEELISIAASYGYSDVYMYGSDEATGEALVSQKKAWSTVHKKGGKIYAAGYSGHAKEMDGLTDVLVKHGGLDSSEARLQHYHGKKIYSYSNPSTGVENAALIRKNYGLRLWQEDYDGTMPYAYQHAMGFIWNDFDHWKYRDLVYAYPTVDGVIDTIAIKGFRAAVDDVRYLTLLKELLERIHTSSGMAELREEGVEFMRELKAEKNYDPDLVRQKIAGFIEKLESKQVLKPNAPRVLSH